MLFLPVDDSMDLCPEDFEYLRREAEKSLDEQPLIVRMGSNSFEYVKDLDRLKEDALKEMWRTNSSW